MKKMKRYLLLPFCVLAMIFLSGSVLSSGADVNADNMLFPGIMVSPLPLPQPEETPEPAPDPDPAKPMVALTFDDGPGAATDQILDLLEEYGGRATFFVVGYLLDSSPETLRRMAEQGSELASHTWDHKSLTKMTAQELQADFQKVSDKIFEIAGVRPSFIRPPYGDFNSRVKAAAADCGAPLLLWSIDPNDWQTRNAETTYQRIMKDVKDGSIILCHDSHKATGEAMEKVIPELIEQGYQLVTVSELFTSAGKELHSGETYFSR